MHYLKVPLFSFPHDLQGITTRDLGHVVLYESEIRNNRLIYCFIIHRHGIAPGCAWHGKCRWTWPWDGERMVSWGPHSKVAKLRLITCIFTGQPPMLWYNGVNLQTVKLLALLNQRCKVVMWYIQYMVLLQELLQWQRKMVGVRACVTKMVCERWCVCKIVCGKDGVWKMVWRKMVCDRAVCERWCGERWCVTKLCVKDGVVKDGVWQSGVWRMVCERWSVTVCERWCVTKWCERWCVKNGVSKMVCERWCVTKWCVKDGVVKDGVWKMECYKDGA